MTGRPPGRHRRRPRGVSMSSRVVERRRRRAPAAGELEVVARGVAEGAPDEALQRRGSVAAARAPGGAPVRARRASGDPPEVAPRRAARVGRRRGTRARRRAPARATSGPLRQAAGEPRGGAMSARAEAAVAGRAAQAGRSVTASTRRPRRAPGRGVARPASAAAAALEGGLLLGRVDGQIGLKLYHCSGAARDRRREGVGDRLGRALELAGIATRSRRSGSAQVELERVVRLAADRDGHDRRAGLRGEGRRAGRQGRPRAEEPDRDAVGAVAPVDDRREHLAPAQDAVDVAQVAPRDECDAPRLALRGGGSSNSSGNAVSSARTLIGHAVAGDGRRDGLDVADVGDARIRPLPRRLAPEALERVDVHVRRRVAAASSCGRAAGASARRRSARTSGRRAGPCGGPADGPAAGRGRGRSWRSTSAASSARARYDELGQPRRSTARGRRRRHGRERARPSRGRRRPPGARRREAVPPRRCGASSAPVAAPRGRAVAAAVTSRRRLRDLGLAAGQPCAACAWPAPRSRRASRCPRRG